MKSVFETTKDIQKRVFQNKKNHGFNITDVSMEFCLTFGELSEAYESWRKKKGNLGEELADTVIYLLGLAEINGIDLGVEIDEKMTVNEGRIYKKDENGVLVRQDQ